MRFSSETVQLRIFQRDVSIEMEDHPYSSPHETKGKITRKIEMIYNREKTGVFISVAHLMEIIHEGEGKGEGDEPEVAGFCWTGKFIQSNSESLFCILC